MTSHVRHRRGPLTVGLLEPGELNVDPPARQLTAGDIGGAAGEPIALLAVRFFDTRSSYAQHDYAIEGGSLYRALAAIPPGPFDKDQWEVISGVSTGGPGGGGEHTPLHGFADGFNHTLLLHGLGNDATTVNTIDLNNMDGQTVAKVWASDLVGDKLRIQSAGTVAIEPGHLGFDDSAKVVEIDSSNLTVSSKSNGGLLLRNSVNADTGFNAIEWRNSDNATVANMWALAGGSGLYVQSFSSINFVPAHVGNDALGTVLRVNSGNVHVYGSLTVDGGANIDGSLGVGGSIGVGASSSINGNLTLGNNAIVSSASGYLHMQGQANLYLRSNTGFVEINDTGGPTVVGGTLSVNGLITGGNGAVFLNDVRVARGGNNTGLVSFGNGTAGFIYDGADMQVLGCRVATVDPINAAHVATKAYVDAHAGAGFLPLAGGIMTGTLQTAPGSDLPLATPATNLLVFGPNGPGAQWGAMGFLVQGTFGANFGLRSDGNFYMGGWSHGAGTLYKFWTSREVSIAPFSDIRLAFAADAYGGGGAPEPYPGAFVTGFLVATGLIRYRWVQVLIGTNWVTVATV